MSRFEKVERTENGKIIMKWPEDSNGTRHYGIVFTCVRVKTLEEARKIAKTINNTGKD